MIVPDAGIAYRAHLGVVLLVIFSGHNKTRQCLQSPSRKQPPNVVRGFLCEIFKAWMSRLYHEICEVCPCPDVAGNVEEFETAADAYVNAAFVQFGCCERVFGSGEYAVMRVGVELFGKGRRRCQKPGVYPRHFLESLVSYDETARVFSKYVSVNVL